MFDSGYIPQRVAQSKFDQPLHRGTLAQIVLGLGLQGPQFYCDELLFVLRLVHNINQI